MDLFRSGIQCWTPQMANLGWHDTAAFLQVLGALWLNRLQTMQVQAFGSFWEIPMNGRYLASRLTNSIYFLRLCDQGSRLFSTRYQGLKRLNPIVYINSRPYESLQLAQVDLLLQKNVPGQQIKKVPSQSDCQVESSHHFCFGDVDNFSGQFWHFMELDFGWF